MKIAFWGTSLTGVDDWQKNSFVLLIEKEFPKHDIFNFGIGGANSSKILKNIREHKASNTRYDISFIEMGTNDIFRKHQGRLEEAIDLNTFKENYSKAIKELLSISQRVVCLSSPPVSDNFEFKLNPEIEKYNSALKEICENNNCEFIDIYSKFDNNELWSDGLHLNNNGDKIFAIEIAKKL